MLQKENKVCPPTYLEDTQIFVKDAEQLSSAVQQLHSYIIDVYQMSNKAYAYHIQCAFLKTWGYSF